MLCQRKSKFVSFVTIVLILWQPVSGVRQQSAPWHLARLSALDHWLDQPTDDYDFYPAKSPVVVYILDTGIDVNHPEFGDRASLGINFYGRSAIDDNGMGTHIAGLVGSKTYGVAKKANLVGVKVFSGVGTGRQGDLMDAIRWSRGDATDKAHTVICVPRSGPWSEAMNTVVNNTVKAGVPVIVAAGDYVGRDAGLYSPGSAEYAYTVGATDYDDNLAKLSNTGPSIRLLAPGEEIESTGFLHRSPEDEERPVRVMSGTGQATAIVCGLAAYFRSLDMGTASPFQLYDLLDNYAMKDLVGNLPNDTVNSLAQNNF
ncbi:Subtilase-type proteinase psp3 [Halotydeus destructor]|nr:Subtilase-type proteinase psp3 [Halotydeus destructor]